MKIIDLRTYVGPNQFRALPCIAIQLDLEELANDKSTKLLKPLQNYLIGQLFALANEKTVLSWFASYKKQPLAYVFADLYLNILAALLDTIKQPSTDIHLQPLPHSGRFRLLYDYQQPECAGQAGRLAFNFIKECAAQLLPERYPEPQAFFFRVELNEFKQKACRLQPDTLRMAIIAAANKAYIPFIELDGPLFFSLENPGPPELEGVLQLGYGNKQQRIKNSLLNKTQFQTDRMMQDIKQRYQFLAEQNFPLPRLDPHGSQINSFLRAKRSAERIGYPVTMRYIYAEQPDLAFTQIESSKQLEKLFQLFKNSGGRLLLEKSVNGSLYQLLTTFGQAQAALKFQAIQITGDGKNSLLQLLRQFAGRHLTEAFFQPHRFLDTCIPEPGLTLHCMHLCEPETVYTQQQVQTQFHQELVTMALIGANKLQLPIAAMNFVCTDPALPLKQSGGAVLNFTGQSDFRFYHSISDNFLPTLADRIVQSLFPEQENGIIPLIAVTGTNGKTTTCRAIAHILAQTGKQTGLACTDGIYINNQLLQQGTFSGVRGTQMLLSHPELDAAVIEVSRGTLNKQGLGYERSNIGMCINIQSDHIGCDGIDNLEAMAALKQVVTDYATDLVIVNADDPLTLPMAAQRPIEQVCLVSLQAGHTAINQHIEQGGRAVIKQQSGADAEVHYYNNGVLAAQFPLSDIPMTLNGLAEHNVQNAMFAIAAALGAEITPEQTRSALAGFTTSQDMTPGRLNFIENQPFQLVLDYAHNVDGLQALTHVTRQLSVSGKRILLFVIPGDRREEDFQACADAVAGEYDYYICRDTMEPRGEPGRAPELLRKCLLNAGQNEDQTKVIINRDEAIAHALSLAEKGDLLVIVGSSNPDIILQQLQKTQA